MKKWIVSLVENTGGTLACKYVIVTAHTINAAIQEAEKLLRDKPRWFIHDAGLASEFNEDKTGVFYDDTILGPEDFDYIDLWSDCEGEEE